MSVRIITIIALFLAFLVAAPVTAYLYAQSTVSTEVRITARLLENGKVEFGLQQRTGDGWGETILPRVNKFPYATADVDRWLFSSPVEIEVDMSIAAEDPPPTETSIGAWRHFTGANVAGELTGYQLDGTPGGDYQRAWLYLRCTGTAEPDAYISTDELLFNDNTTDRITVHYRITGTTQQTARWWSNEDFDSTLFSNSPGQFVAWLERNYQPGATLYFAASDAYDTYTASFVLTGLQAVIDDLSCF